MINRVDITLVHFLALWSFSALWFSIYLAVQFLFIWSSSFGLMYSTPTGLSTILRLTSSDQKFELIPSAEAKAAKSLFTIVPELNRGGLEFAVQEPVPFPTGGDRSSESVLVSGAYRHGSAWEMYSKDTEPLNVTNI